MFITNWTKWRKTTVDQLVHLLYELITVAKRNTSLKCPTQGRMPQFLKISCHLLIVLGVLLSKCVKENILCIALWSFLEWKFKHFRPGISCLCYVFETTYCLLDNYVSFPPGTSFFVDDEFIIMNVRWMLRKRFSIFFL